MSAGDPAQANSSPPPATQSTFASGISGFWGFVWLAITLAGTLFGLLLGLIFLADEGFGAAIFGAGLGAIIGLLCAGIVSVPVVFMMAIASWAIGTRLWRAILATVAGGATGILSALPIANWDELELYPAATGVATPLAALLGTTGAWIAALLWARCIEQTSHPIGETVSNARVPVANRFFRIGVPAVAVAVVIAACFAVDCASKQAREAAHRARCMSNLKQIAMCLQNYEMRNHSLPPAYITDKAGKPVLSWRVAAAPYYFYNTHFSEQMDLGQPWNSPKNAEFLGCFHAGSLFHCCSSGKGRENPLTDYVAVVGPETLWPGKAPGDLRKHRKGILVVEWPKSDIHWAEPRDITVEEFLDWFRTKPPEQGSFHPGCLLYVDAEGNVGELRNDTDPETVRKLLAGQPTDAEAAPVPSGK